MTKYLIIYTIIRLSSFPTYCERIQITDETFDREQATEFFQYVYSHTDSVRLDSIINNDKCHTSDLFDKWASH